MAVERFKVKQLGEDFRRYPIDDHGKWRLQAFTLDATTIVGDANSTIDLFMLPPGRVRLLLNMSWIKHSAFGAARTLTIGNRAYNNRPVGQGTAEVEDLDAFAQALDVSAAGVKQWDNDPIWFDIYSVGGVMVSAQVLGGTIPIGATLSGYCAYIAE